MMLWDDAPKDLDGRRVRTEWNWGLIGWTLFGCVFWMVTIWLASTVGQARRNAGCAETAEHVAEYVREASRGIALAAALDHALQTMHDEPEAVFEVQP